MPQDFVLDLLDGLLIDLLHPLLLLPLDLPHVLLLLLGFEEEGQEDGRRYLLDLNGQGRQLQLDRGLDLPVPEGGVDLGVVEVLEYLLAVDPALPGLGAHPGDQVEQLLQLERVGGVEFGPDQVGGPEHVHEFLLGLGALLVDVGVQLGDDLEHDDAHGVDVGELVGDVVLLGQLLEGHVVEGALPGEGALVLLGEDGEAEVGDLEDPLLEEDVGQLEVLVDDPRLPEHAVPLQQLIEY